MKTNLGKLRIWSAEGGDAPPGFEHFDDEVWTGNKRDEENGLKILGTPLGKAVLWAGWSKSVCNQSNCWWAKSTKCRIYNVLGSC